MFVFYIFSSENRSCIYWPSVRGFWRGWSCGLSRSDKLCQGQACSFVVEIFISFIFMTFLMNFVHSFSELKTNMREIAAPKHAVIVFLSCLTCLVCVTVNCFFRELLVYSYCSFFLVFTYKMRKADSFSSSVCCLLMRTITDFLVITFVYFNLLCELQTIFDE